MHTFFKANIAAVTASIVDYAVTVGAIYFFNVDVVAAAIAGVVSGGIINFFIGRYWAFNSRQNSTYSQAYKYLVVWVGNLILSAGGMYLLTKQMFIHYALAKLVTALLIAVIYNYPLQ